MGGARGSRRPRPHAQPKRAPRARPHRPRRPARRRARTRRCGVGPVVRAARERVGAPAAGAPAPRHSPAAPPDPDGPVRAAGPDASHDAGAPRLPRAGGPCVVRRARCPLDAPPRPTAVGLVRTRARDACACRRLADGARRQRPRRRCPRGRGAGAGRRDRGGPPRGRRSPSCPLLAPCCSTSRHARSSPSRATACRPATAGGSRPSATARGSTSSTGRSTAPSRGATRGPARAGTVHLGGSMREVAASEDAVHRGRVADRPVRAARPTDDRRPVARARGQARGVGLLPCPERLAR